MILPSVIASMVLVATCNVWFLWILCTLRFPPVGSTEPFRLVTRGQLAGVTAATAALALAVVLEGVRARRSPPGLRRGHLAGALLALVALALLEAAVFLAYGPLPHG